MKPSLGMVEHNAGTGVHDEKVKAKPLKKTWVVVCVTVLSAVLVAGVAIGTFYLGTKSCNDNYKDAWVTFKRPSSDNLLRERIIVHGNEVELIRPGLVDVVIDYEKNLLVMQYDTQLKLDESSICYVYEFPPGMFGSKHNEMQEQTGVVEVKQEVRFAVERTNKSLPVNMLSAKARDMCFGATAMQMYLYEIEEAGRQKRQVHDDCGGWWTMEKFYQMCNR